MVRVFLAVGVVVVAVMVTRAAIAHNTPTHSVTICAAQRSVCDLGGDRTHDRSNTCVTLDADVAERIPP